MQREGRDKDYIRKKSRRRGQTALYHRNLHHCKHADVELEVERVGLVHPSNGNTRFGLGLIRFDSQLDEDSHDAAQVHVVHLHAHVAVECLQKYITRRQQHKNERKKEEMTHARQ